MPRAVRPASGSPRGQLGTPRDNTISGTNNCYLPNAAIALETTQWLLYPPAFHSNNLFFNNVDIRHYVISPLFQPGTLITDPVKVQDHYCQQSSNMFINWTDVDRQTELDDDDGSLTGFAQTVSVNLDPFFIAPVEGVECASGPYKDPLTSPLPPGRLRPVRTTMLPLQSIRSASLRTREMMYATATRMSRGKLRAPTRAVTEFRCTGNTRQIRKRTARRCRSPIPDSEYPLDGQSQAQRSGLTVNNAQYYIDTSVGKDTQTSNVFEKGHTYYTYLLFAKPNTKQTYQIYVGKDPTWDPKTNVQMVRAEFPDFLTFSTKGHGLHSGSATRRTARASVTIPRLVSETLTLDMNGYTDFKTAYDDSKASECAPAGFCAPM